MALNPQTIIDGVQDDLGEDSSSPSFWTDADCVRYINQALSQLAVVRPDAFAKTYSYLLPSTGTKQAIPSGHYRLLSVVRNMGTDGVTPGYPVRHITRAEIDAFQNWHKGSGTSFVRNYHYDPDVDPYFFYVWPYKKSGTNVYLEIVSCTPHTTVTTANQSSNLDYPLDDRYLEPIRAWMMRCAYLKQTSKYSAEKAQTLEQSFYTMLGVKGKIDMMLSGKKEEKK